MKEKVAYRDLKGLLPGTVNESSVAKSMAAAVHALTNVTIKADEQNEAQREEAKEPKDIDTLFPDSKLDTLVSLVQVPKGEKPEDLLPVVYSNLANKKKNNSNHSIFYQAVRDVGKTLKIKAPVMPLCAVTSLLALMWEGIDVADLGSGILPMAFIPNGAITPKAKASTLAIMRAVQSSEDAAGNMTVADSVALNQAGGRGYIPEDFPELDLQVKGYTLSWLLWLEPNMYS